MATQGLSIRALTRVQATKSGLPQAKKLADLYIKSHTNDAGDVVDANVYQYAIDTYLAPFAGQVDADRAIATYANKVKDISSKSRTLEDTVAGFKRRELEAWFNDVDGEVGFRNPEVLAMNTSQALDSVLVEVLNAIDERRASNQSIDTLVTYADTLAQRSDAMRDLSNKLVSGNVPAESLDGFGYYVDSNPLDGSVRGAALVPVNLAPEQLTANMRRVQATAPFGNGKLPVYLPAQQDEFGQYKAKLGNNEWQGTGTGAMTGTATEFEPDQFSISDSAKYPVKRMNVGKGEFATIPLGARSADGKPTDSIVYRGFDDKLYSVDDPDVFAAIKSDQFLGKKLDGYMTRLSPTEAAEVRQQVTPLSTSVVSRNSKIIDYGMQAQKARAEYEAISSFGGQAKLTGENIVENVKGAASTVGKFFQDRVNKPVVPERGSQSSGGQSIGEKVIESGKGFFRSLVGK